MGNHEERSPGSHISAEDIIKQLRVLHIRDSGGLYGGERAILTLAKNLDRDFFDLTLLCMRRPDGRSDPLISMAREMGIGVRELDVSKRLDVRALLKLRTLVRATGVSLVHTHDFKSDFYGVWATANTGVRRVATAHGSTRDSLLKKAYLYFDERLAYRFFDRVITVSNELRDQLGVNGSMRGKLVMIPNGLDPELLGFSTDANDIPLDFPKTPGMKVFAVVGRIFPDKGQAVFVQAFARIAREFPEAGGLIAGDGPGKGEVLKLIDSLGLSRRVHCCGARRNIKEIYDLADFLVIPSFTEGLPYVLLEAMALGIPVLATSVGEIPRIVRDGVSGYLVPPGEPLEMARRMRDLLGNPSAAQSMAQAGKRFVEETCSARAMARATEGLYRSLAG